MFDHLDILAYGNADDTCDISCELSTIIWGQHVQYTVDKQQDNVYSIYVSINYSFDEYDIGQGFQGQALESLKRGLAVGVARWVLSIPLTDGLYHISMYNTEVHAKGFAKLAKRLGFKKTFGNDYGFLVVNKNGKPCRWRTRYNILKLGIHH